MNEKIAVVGLGYVGLPLAIAFARKFKNTIGFDINEHKLATLRAGSDSNGEVSSDDLAHSTLTLSSKISDLADRTFFVMAVPTPVDKQKRPDLLPLIKASETVGQILKPGSVVVYESTVYPGVTEEVCGPVLERVSKLKRGRDFKLGYSPERINPGDKLHTLEKTLKVVSGEDEETLARVAAAYESIVPAGVHRAPCIKVAEAAKVIENTQRDLNIALMNELALIFDRMDIRSRDVLAVAGTKWNFLPFKPGLVGGHCIGVDPYYLTAKAEELGYHPQVILAGRKINDGMGAYIGQRLVKLLARADLPVKKARVGILGLSFKENVPDIRNSRVPEIVTELQSFGIDPLIHDPLVSPEDAVEEYGIKLSAWEEFRDLDAMILAVAHKHYVEMPMDALLRPLKPRGVLMDVKSIFDPAKLPPQLLYWSL